MVNHRRDHTPIDVIVAGDLLNELLITLGRDGSLLIGDGGQGVDLLHTACGIGTIRLFFVRRGDSGGNDQIG